MVLLHQIKVKLAQASHTHPQSVQSASVNAAPLYAFNSGLPVRSKGDIHSLLHSPASGCSTGTSCLPHPQDWGRHDSRGDGLTSDLLRHWDGGLATAHHNDYIRNHHSFFKQYLDY